MVFIRMRYQLTGYGFEEKETVNYLARTFGD